MPGTPCPTQGCYAWHRSARDGHWYGVPSEYQLIIDKPITDKSRICHNCYNRHYDPSLSLDGRIRKPTLFDQLLEAAANPSPPIPLTTPIKQLTPRRRWTLKEKVSVCEEWSEASTTAEKQAIRDKYRAEQLDGHQVQQWRQALARNNISPKGKKAAKHEVRLRGAGRLPQLSGEQEAQIDQWVTTQRQLRLQVLVCQIQHKARLMFPMCQDGVTSFKGGWKWAAGFMARHRLTVRLATTNKAVNTPDMRKLQFHFRNKLAVEYHHIDPLLIYNMDETSVTLDAPGLRTVDRIGAKCVEIATTGHDFKRVAVVICVSRGGALVTPLVLRSGGKTSRYFHQFVWESHGGMEMWVTENKKAWLDSASMAGWIETVYVPFVRTALSAPHCLVLRQDISHTHLFMDNCSVHDSDVSMAAMLRHNVNATFFPPNCTPILQPCDQNINHIFKLEYERRWREWMASYGHTADNVTRFGNPAAAEKTEYMSWIGQALRAIDRKVIEDSWKMSCAGYRRSVFHLQPALWKRVLSFLNDGPAFELPPDKDGKVKVVSSDTEQLADVTRDRKLFTAWRHFTFPAKKKRKAAQVEQPVVTSSTPSKRRKGRATADDDDMQDSDGDKENQPPEQPIPAAATHQPWEADVAAVKRMADEADRRKRLRTESSQQLSCS